MYGFSWPTKSGNGFAKTEKTVNASSWFDSTMFSINEATDSGFSMRSFLNSFTLRLTGALSIADKDIFLKELFVITSSSSSTGVFFLRTRRIIKNSTKSKTANPVQNHHFVKISLVAA